MKKQSGTRGVELPKTEPNDLSGTVPRNGDEESISAKELAFLAAILSPEECKTGAAGSALRHALALFMESNEVVSAFNSAVAKDDLIEQLPKIIS